MKTGNYTLVPKEFFISATEAPWEDEKTADDRNEKIPGTHV